MLTSETYLVRHGDYQRPPEELTQAGIADSQRALERLLQLGLDHTAMVLSSDAPRALGTANVIATGLSTIVIPSKRINEGGNEELGVKDLDDWILRALQEAAVEPSNRPLVVVTHEPLIRIVAKYNNGSGRVGNGEVVPYTPGTWSNPQFQKSEELYLEQQIKASLQ